MTNNKDLLFYARKIHECIFKKVNYFLKKYDVTLHQLNIMTYLYEQEAYSSSQKDIEKYFDISHESIIGLLKRMSIKNYVTIEVNPNDRRSRIVKLSKEGIEKYDEIMQFKDIGDKHLKNCISQEKYKILEDIVYEIYTKIDVENKSS